ncbi:uncharacterized protein [Panulirus ornatus]|uniref:uncharacterized protein n=1 Tax=Panulirus ornatus TaxID=150431 RepID=UPI003A88542C
MAKLGCGYWTKLTGTARHQVLSSEPPCSALASGAALARPGKVLALVGATYAQEGYNVPPPPPSGYSYGTPDLRAAASTLEAQDDPIAVLAANIPGGGVAGQDYPILASVPDTGFSCEDQQFPGYYADTADEAGCQVFHICQLDGRLDSFLCPNGTVFNQQYFVCDWWYNVDCSASEQYFDLNSEIGRIPEDAAASLRSGTVAPSQLYGPPEVLSAPSQRYNQQRLL